jgi:protoheme IX farnesyltransferase
MKPWLELLKLRITIASTVTTVVGYAMARGTLDSPLVLVTGGIFLQACGAAALNQVQDSNVDAKMARTASRPIPSGRIKRGVALVYALSLLVLGSFVLGTVSWTAALVGLSAAVVYNGVYTPLKRVTPFAALPGSLIGALPPVVGWVAAGGYLLDPTIHLVAFFFFLWQIPHFWLLLLYYEQDYQDGGMPSLFDRFDRRQIARLTFLWIAAVCVAALLLPMVRVFDHPVYAYAVAALGLVVVLRATALLRADADAGKSFAKVCRIRFMEINTFALLVSVALVVDGLM